MLDELTFICHNPSKFRMEPVDGLEAINSIISQSCLIWSEILTWKLNLGSKDMNICPILNQGQDLPG